MIRAIKRWRDRQRVKWLRSMQRWIPSSTHAYGPGVGAGVVGVGTGAGAHPFSASQAYAYGSSGGAEGGGGNAAGAFGGPSGGAFAGIGESGSAIGTYGGPAGIVVGGAYPGAVESAAGAFASAAGGFPGVGVSVGVPTGGRIPIIHPQPVKPSPPVVIGVPPPRIYGPPPPVQGGARPPSAPPPITTQPSGSGSGVSSIPPGPPPIQPSSPTVPTLPSGSVSPPVNISTPQVGSFPFAALPSEYLPPQAFDVPVVGELLRVADESGRFFRNAAQTGVPVAQQIINQFRGQPQQGPQPQQFDYPQTGIIPMRQGQSSNGGPRRFVPATQVTPAPVLDTTTPCPACDRLSRQRGEVQREIQTELQQQADDEADSNQPAIQHFHDLEQQPASTRNIPQELQQKRALVQQLTQQIEELQQGGSSFPPSSPSSGPGGGPQGNPAPVLQGPPPPQLEVIPSGQPSSAQPSSPSSANAVSFCVGCQSQEDAILFLNGESAACSVIPGSTQSLAA